MNWKLEDVYSTFLFWSIQVLVIPLVQRVSSTFWPFTYQKWGQFLKFGENMKESPKPCLHVPSNSPFFVPCTVSKWVLMYSYGAVYTKHLKDQRCHSQNNAVDGMCKQTLKLHPQIQVGMLHVNVIQIRKFLGRKSVLGNLVNNWP